MTSKSSMYPSSLRTCAIPAQILLLGMRTWRRPTRLALRIRVSISAMGSWLFIAFVSLQRTHIAEQSILSAFLPTGFAKPRKFATEGKLTKHDSGDLELPQESARAAGQLATVARARRARIARQFGQSGKVLFLLQLPPNIRVTLC